MPIKIIAPIQWLDLNLFQQSEGSSIRRVVICQTSRAKTPKRECETFIHMLDIQNLNPKWQHSKPSLAARSIQQLPNL